MKSPYAIKNDRFLSQAHIHRPGLLLKLMPPAAQMDQSKGAASLRRESSAWLLKLVILAMIMSAQTEVPPTGLLCISECATCPVICSPPPPPTLEFKPPPSPLPHHSPTPSYHSHSPPPPPPPPRSSPPHSSSPPPPFIYFTWDSPPPPFNYMGIPSVPAPPTKGKPDYSYPYYYFYASNSFSLSFSVSFLFMAFSIHAMFFCW